MREITRKPLITVENIIRVLSVIVTIIFFCPTYVLSFTEQKVGVSAMNLVGGMKHNGEAMIKPQFVLLLLFLLPVAILVVLFLRQITEEKVSLITTGCAVLDLVILFVSCVIANNMANKYALSIKVTAWFVFNIIFLLFIIALAILTLLRTIYLEEDLLALCRGTAVDDTFDRVSSAVSQVIAKVTGKAVKESVPQEDIMGYCFKCGTAIVFGDEFCTSCGWPVPEAFIAEAEEERRAAEEARRAEEEAIRAAEEAARREAEERARREAEERERREAEERARREAEERERREAEEARRRAEEERRRLEEEKRAAEEERRRAEEEEWLREEDERRRRNAERRRERPERRRITPPRRMEEDVDYLDEDFVDERTDREIAKLAYEPEDDLRPRPDSRRRSDSRSRSRARSRDAARPRAVYCLRCGEKLPSDAAFCAYCGAKLSE